MRAWELTATGVWRSVTRPDPRPAPGQVLVRVRAVSLNYRDLLVAKGLYGGSPTPGRIPCSDGAGEVVAVGEGVRRWKVGDRVAGTFFQDWISGEPPANAGATSLGGPIDGMLAELVALSEEGVVSFPEHLSLEEAATLPCAGVTSWNALVTRGQIAPGETVLVQGTGGVSLFALQIARLAGARVVVTSRSAEKLARARALGAWEGIQTTLTPAWDVEAKRLTGGRGVDHVIDVGGAGTLGRSFEAVRVGGRVSLIGVLTGFSGEVNPVLVLAKSITLQGIFVGSRDMFLAFNRAIEAGKLRPVVDRVFPFAEAPAALAHLESGAHFGKLVVSV